MGRRLSISMFRDLFVADEEFAVIDPRTEVDFSGAHLLAASNLPLENLGARIGFAVPRPQTLCVLCDNGGGEADAALALLSEYGYRNCAVLEGGVDAWRRSGGAVFSGTSVPGKAFGEFIAETCHTPSIDAAGLRRRLKEKTPLLIVDSRSVEEHRRYCIPGAVSCPGAELIYRVVPLISPRTEVVVHCGGRTRGIIGAQTLVDAGCLNVAVLENGTMGWQAEGLSLESGNRDELPPPDTQSTMLIRAVADRLSQSWFIDRVDSIATVDHRNRYLIDVRGREEYEAGHVAGSIHVPGGQLLQHVDRYLVVRNSIVILIDSDWVRAMTTAVWLRRMGWRRVYVHTITGDRGHLQTGGDSAPEALDDLALDPSGYDDPAESLRANQAYLEWECALYDMLYGEPAAPYMVPSANESYPS